MGSKEAYQQKLRAQLDEWEAKVKELEAKASQVGADARIEYQDHIQGIRARQAEVRKKFEELDAASDDAWRDLKQGMQDSWSRLGQAVQAAYSRFKE